MIHYTDCSFWTSDCLSYSFPTILTGQCFVSNQFQMYRYIKDWYMKYRYRYMKFSIKDFFSSCDQIKLHFLCSGWCYFFFIIPVHWLLVFEKIFVPIFCSLVLIADLISICSMAAVLVILGLSSRIILV